MFGKILKDENFDLALKSSARYDVRYAQFNKDIDTDSKDGNVSVYNKTSYRCALNKLMEIDNWIGYDESILEYSTLEGTFKAVSYVLVTSINEQYTPAIYLDLSFISRYCPSEDLRPIFLNNSESFAFEKHFNRKKIDFIESLQISNHLFMMDGPLFSGVNTQFNFRRDLKNVYVHFVKNSTSSQIIDYLGLNEFNNDMHWAMKTLAPLERSPIYSFTSDDGRRKLYCYLKVSNRHSPVRVEVAFENSDIFAKEELWNTICHQYLASGMGENSQPRLIYIAEKYAREALKNSRVMTYLSQKGFIPTTNEMRF